MESRPVYRQIARRYGARVAFLLFVVRNVRVGRKVTGRALGRAMVRH